MLKASICNNNLFSHQSFGCTAALDWHPETQRLLTPPKSRGRPSLEYSTGQVSLYANEAPRSSKAIVRSMLDTARVLALVYEATVCVVHRYYELDQQISCCFGNVCTLLAAGHWRAKQRGQPKQFRNALRQHRLGPMGCSI